MNFQNIGFECSAYKISQLPSSSLPEVAFSGRSNVGKSSLLNCLANRRNLARVSSSPGKTGSINFFRLENCRLVDLPGYGYAKVAKSEKLRWGELVEYYFGSGRNIALVVELVDMRHSPSADDLDMINFLRETDLPFLLVLTKEDKLSRADAASQLGFFSELLGGTGISFLPFSSKSGVGLEELKTIIAQAVEE